MGQCDYHIRLALTPRRLQRQIWMHATTVANLTFRLGLVSGDMDLKNTGLLIGFPEGQGDISFGKRLINLQSQALMPYNHY